MLSTNLFGKEELQFIEPEKRKGGLKKWLFCDWLLEW